MVGAEAARLSLTNLNMQTTCGALLSELEQIWTDIGEDEVEKDKMMLELEMECLQLYQRKVDEARNTRSFLRQSLLTKEAEMAALMGSLGEHNLQFQTDRSLGSLRRQVAFISQMVEDLRLKKDERAKKISEIKSEIEKIIGEINGCNLQINNGKVENDDFSIRMLNDYQAQLRSLQKEKSKRVHKVLESVNEVHSLCSVLGNDFVKTLNEVHPSLHEPGLGQSTNISDSTLEGLSQMIQKLKTEKRKRIQTVSQVLESLTELWNLLDSPEEERKIFENISCIFGSREEDVTNSGVLSIDTVKEIEAEVGRLTKLKASKMKELVLKKRLELEEVCRQAHIEPDMSTASDKLCALIDSALVDPSELLANIESQIIKAREESYIRKDIIDRVSKWEAACAEERWLEEYNQDENRYSAGKGAHLNLKHAEKARVTAVKIPAIIDNLMSKTIAWEDERNMHFLYDGVRLISLLEEYKLARQQKEDEKKRFRDQKKLQHLLLTEKEALYGSKSSPKRSNSLRKPNGCHAYGNGNGFMTPGPRRISIGSATPELLTPRSYSGRQNGYFKEMRRLSTAPLNFVALPKEDTISSFASISCFEPGSPPRG
ncbi:65-kDa microtubule-associated protein 6-like [Phalaenopsis equestris]|uniref:65-kDa microtubule-associated protein 6-like n=1 Tax=Phalaenopsis equestris TaxID=78828 RepID=UPI0009E6393E|nr:65-kDa microtubule-associated protein 6-like [Phalaenopsis equestris]